MCLLVGKCLTALDYKSSDIEKSDVSGFSSMPLKILDDPVLDMIMPKGTLTVGRQIIILIQWLPSVFAILVISAIFISRLTILSKPIRQDVRNNPISVPTPESIDLFQD